MFCLGFLYNTNLVSQKSQLVWKLIYARHASNYIHETGTYRAKTQCTNTRKTLQNLIQIVNKYKLFFKIQPNLPLSLNFIVLKALYYFKLGNIIGLLECYCISALAERAAFAIA